MKCLKSGWMAAFLVAGAFLVLAPPHALGQGCALCYTQAANSGSRMIQALRSGILILIAPPTLMSLGLVVVCYRKRNNTRKECDELESDWEKQESEKW